MPDAVQQQFCLKWNNHQTNLLKVFTRLLTSEHFTDVILAAEGRSVKAHRVVLSACSAYFEHLLADYGDRVGCPIIILKDVSFADLSAIIEFMYKGEINVTQEKLGTLLKTAENLKVKGLAEVSEEPQQASSSQHFTTTTHSVSIPTPSTTSHSMPYTHPELAAALGGSLGQYPQSPYEAPPTKRKRGRPRLFDSPEGNRSPGFKYESPVITRQESLDPNFEQAPPEESPCPPQDPPAILGGESSPLHSKSEIKNEVAEETENRESPSNDAMDASEEFYKEPSTEPSAKMKANQDILFGSGNVYYCGILVTKLNAYLQHGSRSQFWDEPVTHKIMDAVRNRSLDMKTGADLLGVSYGTLYGRYRETFGYLKHAWNGKKKEKEITPVKAPTPVPVITLSDATITIDKRVLDALLRKDLTLGQASAMLGLTEIEIYAQVELHLKTERTHPSAPDLADERSSDGEGRLRIDSDDSSQEINPGDLKLNQKIEPVNTSRID